jgi:hypothetical protein
MKRIYRNNERDKGKNKGMRRVTTIYQGPCRGVERGWSHYVYEQQLFVALLARSCGIRKFEVAFYANTVGIIKQ